MLVHDGPYSLDPTMSQSSSMVPLMFHDTLVFKFNLPEIQDFIPEPPDSGGDVERHCDAQPEIQQRKSERTRRPPSQLRYNLQEGRLQPDVEKFLISSGEASSLHYQIEKMKEFHKYNEERKVSYNIIYHVFIIYISYQFMTYT